MKSTHHNCDNINSPPPPLPPQNRNLASWISLITWSYQNCLVTVMSSEIDCDVISRTKTERVRHGDDVWRSSFVSSFMESLCHVSNKKCMYSRDELFLRSIECYFWCLFPSLLHNSGNKQKNKPLVSAETVRHSSTFIIHYIVCDFANMVCKEGWVKSIKYGINYNYSMLRSLVLKIKITNKMQPMPPSYARGR